MTAPLLPFFKKMLGSTLADGHAKKKMTEHSFDREHRDFTLQVISVDEEERSVTFEGWSTTGTYTFNKDTQVLYHGTVTIHLDGIRSAVQAQMLAADQLPPRFNKEAYLEG